jgi:hypothetical protein
VERLTASLLKTLICIAALAGLMASCSSRFDEASIQVDQLCSFADRAFKKQDFNDLLPALEGQFHVERDKMRITDQGIFVPMKERFVEEKGYFLARPGVNIILRSGDPAMARVKGCIYRYHIKG